MSQFWKQKKVVITGGAGFIGSHLLERLVSLGSSVTVYDRYAERKKKLLESLNVPVNSIWGDCRDYDSVMNAVKEHEVFIQLAAHVRDVEYNVTHPASILTDNLQIIANAFRAVQETGIERFLFISSACVYPNDCAIPTPESEGARGAPEKNNAGYGWGCRMGEVLARYCHEEYGIKISIVRPYNIYGPRDHFEQGTFHVIPSLIQKVFSGDKTITVWGSGNQTRAFLYIDDLVSGILTTIQSYPQPDPINLGSDEEITIKDLVALIISLSGKDVDVEFDLSKPEGSPRRCADMSNAREAIGFKSNIRLRDGLKRTIEWYEKQ